MRSQAIVCYNRCGRNKWRQALDTVRRSTNQCLHLSDLTPGTWNVDPVHSTVGFVARHLMVSKVRGRFGTFNGTSRSPRIRCSRRSRPPPTSPRSTPATRAATTTSVGRLLRPREATRRSTLVSTGIEPDGERLRAAQRPDDQGRHQAGRLRLEFDGVTTDPWGSTRAGFTAEAEINRKDWGLECNVVLETGGVLIGDKVKIELEIEAVKA